MGMDDRDYMKDRYRKRRGLPTLKWNNPKSRVELDDGVPLGSASWIGKDPGKEFEMKSPDYKARPTGTARGGPWFEPKNQGFDYQKNRWRPKRKSVAAKRRSPWHYLPLGLCLLLVAIPMFGDAKRHGWLPDFEEEVAFPDSGSVTVARSLSMKRVTSSLLVQTSDANAVVQLFDPDTHKHVFSVYVHGNDRVRVPVPRGTYEMRLIEGDKWHGRERFFGANTAYETVAQPMLFEHRGGNGIDLRRQPNGNLPTRPMMSDPDKL